MVPGSLRGFMERSAMNETFVAGGIELPRPFRALRLGHFGINVADVPAVLRFYTEVLGFRVSDVLDFGPRLDPAKLAELGGDGRGYFLRHGTDHHSFVLFPRWIHNALNGFADEFPEVTLNQITWQVGSLEEVVNGNVWFAEHKERVYRAGRDAPGSNWHAYLFDGEGHVNEIYYGIEQIGWDGRSKPAGVHQVRYHTSPELPHRSEYAEVKAATEAGVDPATGTFGTELLEEKYPVDGVLLARPFKIVRVGPVRLFVDDVARETAFYTDTIGLTLTERVTYRGHQCVFFRANTEHHSIALYPKALRAELGLTETTTLMAFGLQVANYRQLRDALNFFRERGDVTRFLPAELTPGIDYSFLVIDPSGHAMHFYHAMEQIGWDGKPRPAAQRPAIDNDIWPDAIAANGAAGEVFLGPWS